MNDSLASTPKCPPGLGYLTQIDHLMVKERVHFLAPNDTFTVKNSAGQNIYWATEEPNCCARGSFGASRPFDVKIMNIQSQEVMYFYRRIGVGYRDSIEVSAPLGKVIGRVKEDWSFLNHSFTVKNHENTPVLRIEAPFFKSSPFGDAEFKILLMDGTQIGRISKKWAGLARELADGHYYGIAFPLELDVRMKAVLLGACIMLNSRFYERL
ncbi:phospholipid scramblase 1-like [Contarinia nasturtii]|uniref:phospholipid scramblase 1-like n=1 Tax=Contarinia nasturtii TaxID=265458 RepID=UPI0012D45A00|nr:phospholipid scramblase 1-like [Contarinia nasturtii]XP_031632027.1 phospholipid scramblase 1-like [Contarinia nasturtii]